MLTAFPNYPKGRVEPGYHGLYQREERDGMSIIRTWIRPSQSVGLAARLKSYFSFVFSSLVVGWFTLGRLDVLLTESPPLFLGIAGYLLARRTRARWIFNVSDLWPESAVHLGAVSPGRALDAAYALERFCYEKAWLVTGQSAEILENIRRRFPTVSTYHLSNGVDTELFEPGLRDAAARQSAARRSAGGHVCGPLCRAARHGPGPEPDPGGGGDGFRTSPTSASSSSGTGPRRNSS